ARKPLAERPAGQVVFQGPAYIAQLGAELHAATGGRVEHVTNERVINIGAGATINAPVTIADQIQDSFNTMADTKLDDGVRKLLEGPLKQVTVASKAIPAQQAQEMARDASALTQEVTSSQPRRKFYEVTIAGLKEAATAVGVIGKPIIETVTKLLP